MTEPAPSETTLSAEYGETSMDGPNSHKMDAPYDVMNWTVILTTREVPTADGRDMETRNEWWHVPTFVLEAAERVSRSATEESLRAALDECRQHHADTLAGNARSQHRSATEGPNQGAIVSAIHHARLGEPSHGHADGLHVPCDVLADAVLAALAPSEPEAPGLTDSPKTL